MYHPFHRRWSLIFFVQNDALTMNHSTNSSDLAPCDFYLFSKLHLPMNGKRFDEIEAIQRASTVILEDIPKDDIKYLFHDIINSEKHCIEAKRNYFQ